MQITAKIWPDKWYLETIYHIRNREVLNIDNPQTFNDKLNWLKLYYHNPILSNLADKYEVKEYIRKCIGSEYVVPNYAVWVNVDDIDISKLPNQFILKATHDSGGLSVCKDKAKFDV